MHQPRVAVAMLLLLAGCTAPDTPATASALPTAAAATPADATPPALPETAPFGAGRCLPLAQWQAEGQRSFVVSSDGGAPEQVETAAQPFTLRFRVSLGGKSISNRLALPDLEPASIVVDDKDVQQQAQVCDGHVFIANLAEERGGVLVIGNLKEGALAMTSLAYDSGDEDTAKVSLEDGAVVVTDSNGSVRLQEPPASDSGMPPHGLVAESVQCEDDAPQGRTWLKLELMVTGGVRGLEYTSVMPDGASCTVTAGLPGDAATLSQGRNVTDIRWIDTEEPAQDSHMRVTRDGDAYTFAPLNYDHPQFCGQSAQLADTVKLRRGTATCTAVEWPK